MINNNVNSYLSYHYANLNSKTRNPNESSKQNLNSNSLNQNSTQSLNSQNTTQNIISNSQNTRISTLVSDKSQAVNEILGFGVDKDGYFTSDFNEKAGIPKDYKIYAKDMQSLVEWELGDKYFYSTHTSIDIAKTTGNAYKVLSQIMPRTSNSSLSQDELSNIAYAFVLDDNLNITQTFIKEEYEAIDLTKDRINLTFNTFGNANFENITIDNIFSHRNGDVRLNKEAYINADGSIEKGGVLMALLNSQTYGATGFLLEGNTKLFGKMTFDKNISNTERKEFINFMTTNKIQSAFLQLSNDTKEWNIIEEQLSMQLYIKRSQDAKNNDLATQARKFAEEYEELINSDLSFDKFKEKYLDFKQRHDEFVEKLTIEEKAKGIDYSNEQILNTTQKNQEEQENKPFKPIQGKSQNTETYTREDIVKDFFLNFLEAQKIKGADILELLEKLHSANVKVDIKA